MKVMSELRPMLFADEADQTNMLRMYWPEALEMFLDHTSAAGSRL
jgi:hypothetical protein